MAHRGADFLELLGVNHPKNGNLIQCPPDTSWARASGDRPHSYFEIFEYVASKLHHDFVFSDGKRLARSVEN